MKIITDELIEEGKQKIEQPYTSNNSGAIGGIAYGLFAIAKAIDDLSTTLYNIEKEK